MPQALGPEGAIAYEVTGSDGDPTVLVHGSWVDRRSWDRVVPVLALSLQVVTYDRRGHGETPPTPRRRPVRDDASDLARVLEAADQYPAHVVGHSYGGAVALRLAIDRPELVRSVAVHEPPFLGLVERPPSLLAAAQQTLSEIRRLQGRVRAGDAEGAAREFVDRFAPGPGAWDRLDPTVRQGFVRNGDRWAEEFDDPELIAPPRSELAGIDLPVLLTTGESSAPLFRAIAEALARTMPNASARTLLGTGHVPHLTHPDVYAGALLSFLLERDVPST